MPLSPDKIFVIFPVEGKYKQCPECKRRNCEVVNVEGLLWSCECGFEEPITKQHSDCRFILVKEVAAAVKELREELIRQRDELCYSLEVNKEKIEWYLGFAGAINFSVEKIDSVLGSVAEKAGIQGGCEKSQLQKQEVSKEAPTVNPSASLTSQEPHKWSKKDVTVLEVIKIYIKKVETATPAELEEALKWFEEQEPHKKGVKGEGRKKLK